MSRTFLLQSSLVLLALIISSCTPTSEQPVAQPANSPTATVPPAEHPTPTPPPTPTIVLTPPPAGPDDIDPNEIVTLLPPDAIPAIWDAEPLWATVKEAEQNDDIADGIDVIGVAIGGQARAYPVPFLSAHEIVNDTIGGTAIAVTW